MFFNILENTKDSVDKDIEFNPAILAQPKGEGLKNKIKFVSKMLKMQNLLRQERENIIKIKNKHNNKLPRGLLQEGKEGKFFKLI